jgi:hypothetical protein
MMPNTMRPRTYFFRRPSHVLARSGLSRRVSPGDSGDSGNSGESGASGDRRTSPGVSQESPESFSGASKSTEKAKDPGGYANSGLSRRVSPEGSGDSGESTASGARRSSPGVPRDSPEGSSGASKSTEKAKDPRGYANSGLSWRVSPEDSGDSGESAASGARRSSPGVPRDSPDGSSGASKSTEKAKDPRGYANSGLSRIVSQRFRRFQSLRRAPHGSKCILNGPERPRMARNGPRMARNGHRMARKRPRLARNALCMARNGFRMVPA